MDVIQRIVGIGNEVNSWLVILAVVGCGIAIAIGGLIQMFGGGEGFRKARPWYIGAVIGLIIILASSSIADFLKMKFAF